MAADDNRIIREKKTMRKLIGIYCRRRHGGGGDLCVECRQLLDYAMHCIDRCPYSHDKPVCGKCPIHCYKPAMREQIRRVMRFSGPRILLLHPVLTLLHHMDGLRPPPGKPMKPGK